MDGTVSTENLVPSEEPVSTSSEPLRGGAVSSFDRVRKFLVDGKVAEGRRHADAHSRFKAEQARGLDLLNCLLMKL